MKLTYNGIASITVLWLMLQKSCGVLETRTTQSSIQCRFYLEISSLYFSFIPDSLNIPVNNSNEDVPQLILDPMI